MNKLIIILIVMGSMLLSSCGNKPGPGTTKPITTDWTVGYSDSKDEIPDEFYKAVIPGSVLLDYMNAKNDPPFYFDENFKKYEFLEDKFWRYQTQFKKPEIPKGQHLYFISKGIDYEFEILMNGKSIHYQEGMFTPVNLVLDGYLSANNELEVIIYPIPKAPAQPKTRRQAKNSVKPPVPYAAYAEW